MNYHVEANVAETKRLTSVNVFKGLFFEYDSFDYKRDFIYLPLQFDPECNGEYWPKTKEYKAYNSRILDFIRVNKGQVFVVKEHPNMIGLREANFYDELKNLGAFIIHPGGDHRRIIKKCKAIATLNSSVGIEGLFFNKPIICLSKPYYSSDCHIIIDSDLKISDEIISSFSKIEFEKSLKDSIAIVLKSSLGFLIPDIRYRENSNNQNYIEEFSEFIIRYASTNSETVPDPLDVYSIVK